MNFDEKAYGSFSLRIENALKYTNANSPILFQLLLTPEMPALYIDETEFEVLRPRNLSYSISEIGIKNIEIETDIYKNVQVYTIQEFTE
ncbi:hypothetical protein MmiEs2_00230 [Methanimicrococcus stummii]|uniref:Uncharacterized protein n=1 Tax=Methanimicrococcus stummii TaxID=3028294 RepID=A0AA96V8Q0_9EURY|nr:hypothetical protein [Methanimicrococcus sp. Es2]WNY27850.1 hypothetical protein MmiEs2_00230 [Methanimicrococcus sp. Es2]